MTGLLEYIDLFIKVFFKINSAKNLYGHCRLGRTHSYGPVKAALTYIQMFTSS